MQEAFLVQLATEGCKHADGLTGDDETFANDRRHRGILNILDDLSSRSHALFQALILISETFEFCLLIAFDRALGRLNLLDAGLDGNG